MFSWNKYTFLNAIISVINLTSCVCGVFYRSFFAVLLFSSYQLLRRTYVVLNIFLVHSSNYQESECLALALMQCEMCVPNGRWPNHRLFFATHQLELKITFYEIDARLDLAHATIPFFLFYANGAHMEVSHCSIFPVFSSSWFDFNWQRRAKRKPAKNPFITVLACVVSGAWTK